MAGTGIRFQGAEYQPHAAAHAEDGPDPFPDLDMYKTELDYDGSGNLVYLGRAVPATATSAAAWQIKRFTYVGTNLTAVEYAGGTTGFTSVWDNRASLSYS